MKEGRFTFRLEILRDWWGTAQRSCEWLISGGAQGQVGSGKLPLVGANPVPYQRTWDCMIFKVPSNLSSMTLWYDSMTVFL